MSLKEILTECGVSNTVGSRKTSQRSAWARLGHGAYNVNKVYIVFLLCVCVISGGVAKRSQNVPVNRPQNKRVLGWEI